MSAQSFLQTGLDRYRSTLVEELRGYLRWSAYAFAGTITVALICDLYWLVAGTASGDPTAIRVSVAALMGGGIAFVIVKQNVSSRIAVPIAAVVAVMVLGIQFNPPTGSISVAERIAIEREHQFLLSAQFGAGEGLGDNLDVRGVNPIIRPIVSDMRNSIAALERTASRLEIVQKRDAGALQVLRSELPALLRVDERVTGSQLTSARQKLTSAIAVLNENLSESERLNGLVGSERHRISDVAYRILSLYRAETLLDRDIRIVAIVENRTLRIEMFRQQLAQRIISQLEQERLFSKMLAVPSSLPGSPSPTPLRSHRQLPVNLSHGSRKPRLAPARSGSASDLFAYDALPSASADASPDASTASSGIDHSPSQLLPSLGTVPTVGTAPVIAVIPVPIEPGANTGTAASAAINTLRRQIQTLEDHLAQNASQLANLRNAGADAAGNYHASRANITTTLLVGTKPDNPKLVSEWNLAQSSLDSLASNINALNSLSASIAADALTARYALDQIQATNNVSGAIDEDHRQLDVLKDETSQTIVLINRLLKAVSEDTQRQTAYIASERTNLTTLASAIMTGELYGADHGSPLAGAWGGGSFPAGTLTYAGTPLVVIRFDRPGVDYQQILYAALSQALQAKPNAGFSVVAVAPTHGTAAAVQLGQTTAKNHAQEVLRSMTDMGVPVSRLAVASVTDPGATSSEVRVFVRY
jgi:hypothetical protein